MTNDLLLNLFLGGFVVVFAAIGFVRGVQREVFVTAAILGGWAIASAWSQRWGACSRKPDVARPESLASRESPHP